MNISMMVTCDYIAIVYGIEGDQAFLMQDSIGNMITMAWRDSPLKIDHTYLQRVFLGVHTVSGQRAEQEKREEEGKERRGKEKRESQKCIVMDRDGDRQRNRTFRRRRHDATISPNTQYTTCSLQANKRGGYYAPVTSPHEQLRFAADVLGNHVPMRLRLVLTIARSKDNGSVSAALCHLNNCLICS